MHPLILTATPEELAFISSLDYGQDREKHYLELNELILELNGRFKEGEFWYPLEVVELGSNSITHGHEKEFIICCLLILSAIESGHCFSHDRESKFSDIESLLSQLPNDMALILLNAYAASE